MMKQARLLFLVVLWAITGCSKPLKDQTSSPGVNDQPDMIIRLTDNSTHNVKDLTGKNILVFFQPDCDHCQREATDFQKNLAAFQACTLYFLTAVPMEEITEFSVKYNLSGHANVHFGFTPAKNILDNYGPISAPSIYIYEDHKLVKHFNGEVSINEVLKYI